MTRLEKSKLQRRSDELAQLALQTLDYSRITRLRGHERAGRQTADAVDFAYSGALSAPAVDQACGFVWTRESDKQFKPLEGLWQSCSKAW
jgi:hypothetical protein